MRYFLSYYQCIYHYKEFLQINGIYLKHTRYRYFGQLHVWFACLAYLWLFLFQSYVYVTVNLDITPSGLVDSAYTSCAQKIENAFMTGSSDVGALYQLYQAGACSASTNQQFIRTEVSSFLCPGFQGTQKNDSEGKTYCGKDWIINVCMFRSVIKCVWWNLSSSVLLTGRLM